jgi:hypothetical protein
MQKLLHFGIGEDCQQFLVFRGSVTRGSRVPGLGSEVSIPREHPCPDRRGGVDPVSQVSGSSTCPIEPKAR